MDENPELSLILAAVAAVVGLWVCWPHLLIALGRGSFVNGTRGGPADLDPANRDEDYQDCYFQLVDIGFQPLGIHWARVGKSLSLSSYVFGFPGQPWMASISFGAHATCLATAFEGNVVLQTLDRETEPWQSDGYRLQGVADKSMREVLEVHRREVEVLIAKGHKPLPAATLDDFARIARLVNSHPASRRWLRGKARVRIFGSTAVGFLLCAFLTGYLFGYANPSTWTGMIALGLWLKWQASSVNAMQDADEGETERSAS